MLLRGVFFFFFSLSWCWLGARRSHGGSGAGTASPTPCAGAPWDGGAARLRGALRVPRSPRPSRAGPVKGSPQAGPAAAAAGEPSPQRNAWAEAVSFSRPSPGPCSVRPWRRAPRPSPRPRRRGMSSANTGPPHAIPAEHKAGPGPLCRCWGGVRAALRPPLGPAAPSPLAHCGARAALGGRSAGVGGRPGATNR